MKKNRLLIIFALAAILFIAFGCSDNDEIGGGGCVEPPIDVWFTFDKDGIPHFKHNSLGEDPNATIRTNVLGCGWKHVSTYEIYSDGNCSTADKDFYKDMIGLSPIHYYFSTEAETDGKMTFGITEYFYSDAEGKKAHIDRIGNFGKEAGVIYTNTGRRVMEIVSLYYFKDKKYFVMGTIEPLCIRDGETVYGYVQYHSMSDKELSNYKDTYTYTPNYIEE